MPVESLINNLKEKHLNYTKFYSFKIIQISMFGLVWFGFISLMTYQLLMGYLILKVVCTQLYQVLLSNTNNLHSCMVSSISI